MQVKFKTKKEQCQIHCSTPSSAHGRISACEYKQIWGDLDPDQCK
jgi:hypothetical protein